MSTNILPNIEHESEITAAIMRYAVAIYQRD